MIIWGGGDLRLTDISPHPNPLPPRWGRGEIPLDAEFFSILLLANIAARSWVEGGGGTYQYQENSINWLKILILTTEIILL